MTADFFELLRRRNIAFVIADTATKFPYAEDLTADFVYCRLDSDKELYASGYSVKHSIGGPIVSSIGAQAGNRETPTSSLGQDRQPALFLFILTMTRRSARPTTLFVWPRGLPPRRIQMPADASSEPSTFLASKISRAICRAARECFR
jgi:hypothetical protein